MSQRQKKKSSQQRKRYFDGAKRREGHSSEAQKKQSLKDPQAKPQVPSSEPPSNKGHEGDAVPGVPKGKDSDSFTQDQMKTFSKRKIISNWAKYDEERFEELDSSSLQQESEEALQDRLLQLFNLPVTHTTPSLTNTDHEISTTVGTIQHQLKESSNFLTLDCTALAEALSALPLCERLDIDPKLMLEVEGETEIASQKSNLHSLIRDRGKGDADMLDLSTTLKRVAVKSSTSIIASSERDIDFEFSSPQALNSTQASLSSKQQLPGSTDAECPTTSTTDEAEELDRLLSKSQPKPPMASEPSEPGPHPHKSQPKPPMASEPSEPGPHPHKSQPKPPLASESSEAASHPQQENKERDQSTISAAATPTNTLPPPAVAVGDDETSELDDMLDELLG